MANCASGPHLGPGMATRLIVPEGPVRPATVGISQQMQLEFAAGVTDFDNKPAGCCQVNLSRSGKPEAGCAITLPSPHSAIRSPLRLERSAALIARRDGVED